MSGVCTHTDTKGKQRKARVRNVLKSSEKNTIFNEHPVQTEQCQAMTPYELAGWSIGLLFDFQEGREVTFPQLKSDHLLANDYPDEWMDLPVVIIGWKVTVLTASMKERKDLPVANIG